MGTGEDTSAGVATEEAQGVAQGFAQDVASIVCKHLENHRLGQLDRERLVFIGTCLVTTTPLGVFT